MRTTLFLRAIVLFLAGGFVPAQAGEEEAEQTEEAVKERVAVVAERVKEALRLPQTVRESREAGVAEEKVREVLEAARARGVPASETRKILETENEELRRGGTPDNFGAAVHRMKESGLRGRELAEAIHAEQVARGMKKLKKKGDHWKAKGKGKWSGKKRQEPEEKEEKGGAAKTRGKQ